MELHQLRYFCAVAERLNFTRAAEREHIAQPSLSQQIIKLEQELGTRLFDRLGRQIRLTPFGRAFLPRARRILREVGDAKFAIQELAGSERGEVSIGAIPTIAPYFLAPRLTTFARKFPRVQLNVVEDITPALVRRLHDGTLDLAVVALPLRDEHLAVRELLREPLYVAVSERHPLSRRQSAPLKRFNGDGFLVLKDGHCFRETALSQCRRARVHPNVVFEGGHFGSILALVAAGFGVAVVPHMATEPGAGCRFVRVSDDQAFRRIALAHLKKRFLGHVERALARHLGA